MRGRDDETYSTNCIRHLACVRSRRLQIGDHSSCVSKTGRTTSHPSESAQSKALTSTLLWIVPGTTMPLSPLKGDSSQGRELGMRIGTHLLCAAFECHIRQSVLIWFLQA